jgi:hypothetical protein
MKPTLGLTAAALAISAISAQASGAYDGNWTLMSAAVIGSRTVDNPECAEMGLRFQITDNQIKGNLQGAGSGAVVSSSGGDPVTGSVQPDGTVKAEWRGVTATGKIAGNHIEMSWQGTCGPRIGSGTRVSG